MVGKRRSVPFGMAYFQKRNASFREIPFAKTSIILGELHASYFQGETSWGHPCQDAIVATEDLV